MRSLAIVEQQQREGMRPHGELNRRRSANRMRCERRNTFDPPEISVAVVALFGQIGNAHRADDLGRVVQLQTRVRQAARALGMQRAPRLPCVAEFRRHTPPYHS